MTLYVARAYDGARWLHHADTESLDTALAQARGLCTLVAWANGKASTAFHCVEVATKRGADCESRILHQWVSCDNSYLRIHGQ